MARSHQNRGQDVPAPNSRYRMIGGRLYYFDGHGQAVRVQDDTGTQAARPAEQARQPPPQGLGNVGRAYSTTFDGAVESNTHSSAAMDPRAYASERATSLPVLDDDKLWELSKVCNRSKPPGKRSLSCNSTTGSYLPGTDTSPVQVPSHTRGIDNSNANYNWGMDQFVANQTVHAGARNNAPSLSIEESSYPHPYLAKVGCRQKISMALRKSHDHIEWLIDGRHGVPNCFKRRRPVLISFLSLSPRPDFEGRVDRMRVVALGCGTDNAGVFD
ncbi:hypothetical protein AUP68_11731 [Ilyonectria robusta]